VIGIEEILTDIDNIQEYIFSLNKEAMTKGIHSLIDQITIILLQLNQENMNTLVAILKKINLGFENDDYLLIADILEFELKPFLKDKMI